MESKDEALLKKHLEKNEELKVLWGQHQKYEKQLEKIDRKPFLTPEEKVEKKRLQLAKLAGKTRIEVILKQYRSDRA